MTEKPATTKRKTTPAKPSLTARKPATAKSPVKEVKGGKKSKKVKGKAKNKKKIVRDSFAMPPADYAKIAELKQVCLKTGVHVKKSELLRAGLHALGKLSATQLKQAIAQMEQIKTGRPKKGGAKWASE